MVLILSSFLFCQSIPDFSLKNIDGTVFKLSEYLGKKIIVVEFWAAWCKPCKKLLKRLNKIYRNYRNSVEVVAISVDDSSAFSMVESYIKGRRFEFTVLLDPDNRVSKMFNPTLKIPFTLILDFQGEIVYTHAGYIPGVEVEIEKVIKQILGSKKP